MIIIYFFAQIMYIYKYHEAIMEGKFLNPESFVVFSGQEDENKAVFLKR